MGTRTPAGLPGTTSVIGVTGSRNRHSPEVVGAGSTGLPAFGSTLTDGFPGTAASGAPL